MYTYLWSKEIMHDQTRHVNIIGVIKSTGREFETYQKFFVGP